MDIFEFALEKERHAERYYRELADKAGSVGLQHILTMLADEEAKHYRTVRQMKAGTPHEVTDTPVLANAKEIFEKMKGSAETFTFDISEVDLYRKACQIETESRKYYLQKADEVRDSHQKDVFKKLAEEENKHLLLVQGLRDFVAMPETYLENAEFSHFDDYVEAKRVALQSWADHMDELVGEGADVAAIR